MSGKRLKRLKPLHSVVERPWPSWAHDLLVADIRADRAARDDKQLKALGVEKGRPRPRPTTTPEDLGWASHGRATEL